MPFTPSWTPKKGEIVLVDCEYANGGYEAEVKYVTPLGMFSRIEHEGEEWQIMTSRLSPLEPTKE